MASGQTINDRILAAKHSIAGQGLAKAVCKATTEELIAPKRKHLDCECVENPSLVVRGILTFCPPALGSYLGASVKKDS